MIVPTTREDAVRPREGGPVARLEQVGLSYGKTRALDDVTLDIPSGIMAGLIGPDGVGKSSLLSLIAGARAMQDGSIFVFGGDMRQAGHRAKSCPRIAFMPQGLGKNLYATLSVEENIDFFGRLFGHGDAERARRISVLLNATGLAPFAGRPAGKLSGGMKQKLGLCCALIHDPDLLILDEPTTGVDPLSRRQFWELIADIRAARPNMSVIVATAYMEEAAQFDWLVAMDEGRVLATGSPRELLAQTDAPDLDRAFIALLPEEKRDGYKEVDFEPRDVVDGDEIAIEAEGLTMRFGDFTAVDNVSFSIRRGEIFGFLGSNGCGKTTTMKMLTGLLAASSGRARLFGAEVAAGDMEIRQRVGYMSQSFSLYGELTVRQNLELHARLYAIPADRIPARVDEMAARFDLMEDMDSLPDALPLGVRQRLSLAVAMVHAPDMLILDEPTSGVDPVARDNLWRILIELARTDNVTIFISTHFMNEAERCDRISLMHAGKVLVSGTPASITESKNRKTLEDAFVDYLTDAGASLQQTQDTPSFKDAVPVEPAPVPEVGASPKRRRRFFSLARMFSYTRREAVELARDPIRAVLALTGSVILMIIMGYGISMDVENLPYAVLDYDNTSLSRAYAQEFAGSRYFIEKAPLKSYADLDARMRAGKISMAIEIPPGFGRDVMRGKNVEIGAWFDGAMPQRAETIKGYINGVHYNWLKRMSRLVYGDTAAAGMINIEARYRYNPDVKSLVAMVPAVIPILLMMIPAMLSALSVVREKELGSIVNFYVTPVSRLEFLLGKQLPYIVLAMANTLLLWLMAVTLFAVPLKGSLAAFFLASLLYVTSATGFGLLISTFMRSQIAAIFGVALLTILPAVQFSGLMQPVTSLEGFGRFLGEIYPTTYYIVVARGTFSKALGFGDLTSAFIALAVAVPVILVLSVLLLKKQAD